MRVLLSAFALIAGFGVPTIAQAQDYAGDRQIVSGNFDRAERMLTAQLKAYPERPELMLNLAAVYRQTNRGGQAQAMYNAVLTQPDMLMDLPSDRTAWSHALAQRGLKQLAGVRLSAR